MAVSVQTPVTVVAVTSDGQTVFDFAFQADEVTDLFATYTAIDGTKTQFSGGTDFTATGLENPNGGTITLTSFGGTQAGQPLVIYRSIPIERDTDYTRDLFADEINAEQNRLFMILQDLNRRIDSAIQVDPGETPPDISAIFAAAAAAAASASDASDSADAAAGHASAASGSASAAAGFVTLSQEWAMNPEDDDVTPGNYSSYHWSRKSRLWAVQAEDVPVSGGEFSAYHWAKKAEETVSAGVADGSVTIPKLAPDVMDLISANIRYFNSGDPLPGADSGPIYHADYGGILVWQVFDANGANYEGYASVDIGMFANHGASVAPTGWLKRNGATLLKADFPALWNWALHSGLVVTWAAGKISFENVDTDNFKLPDTRGYFDRPWSDGASMDSGRTFGSVQGDDNKGHAHAATGLTFTGSAMPGHSHGVEAQSGVNNGPGLNTLEPVSGKVGWVDKSSYLRTLSVSAGTPSGTIGGNTASSGGSESRPHNTAPLGIIKF